MQLLAQVGDFSLIKKTDLASRLLFLYYVLKLRFRNKSDFCQRLDIALSASAFSLAMSRALQMKYNHISFFASWKINK